MKKMKETKGITLIALVITIIVLLILSGVTISQIAGQDSAPEKAVQAKKENEVGAAKDVATMLVTEKIQGYYEEKYVKSPVTTTATNQLAYIVEKLGNGETTGDYTVKVTSAGTITVTKGTGANAETLATGSVSNDGVIAWGDSLSKVINFTITSDYKNLEIPLEAEYGMTWNEWENSEYSKKLKDTGTDFGTGARTGFPGEYQMVLSGYLHGWIIFETEGPEDGMAYEIIGEMEPT